MTDAWHPEPDPFGALEPPRRKPPTAVGVATPPPPGRSPRYYDRHVSRRRRLAEAFAGTVLAASATTLASLGNFWLAVMSTGLGALSGIVLYRATQRVRRVRLQRASDWEEWLRRPAA